MRRPRLIPDAPCRAVFMATLAMLLAVSSVRADWTASGSFFYTDRTYNQSGFTGTAPLPVRSADVEVYDLNTQAILASTATDSVGAFSVNVVDAAVRDVGVRVLSNTSQTPGIDMRVVDDLNSNAVYSYHDGGTDDLGHDPGVDINFGSMTMPAAIGSVGSTDWSSQVFNTFDMCILTADWIASVDGVLPSPPLTVGWNPTSGSGGSSYSGVSNRLNLSDDDGYDDPNIVHEIGHYVEDEFGASRNIGGSHVIGDDSQDPRLAWSEGWATIVSGATLDFHGLDNPNLYSDRDSFGVSGGGGFSYNFETAQNGGSTNEVAVQAAVYDLIDGTTTQDSSPGSDDDALSGLDAEVWAVLEEMRARDLPATNMEDFWDLWRDLGLGSEAGVQTVFASHQIDFMVDSSEPDDLLTAASTLTNAYVEHTFYRSGADPGGDEDWFKFVATAGTYYRIEVSGADNSIYGRPDPELYLLDTDGLTVLAHNDDPFDVTLNGTTTNNKMNETVPEILWRATTSGTFYVHCRHASHPRNLGGRYGTYRIRVTTAGTPSPTVADVAAQRMLPGQEYRVLITGDNMAANATVSTSSSDVTVSDTRWISPQAIVATLVVDDPAPDGSHPITVTNPGAGNDSDPSAFAIDNATPPAIILTEVDLGTVDRVEVKNLGTVPAVLTGWQVIGRSTSSTQQTFTFPSFTLPAGATVLISESSGSDTATDLFDQGGTFNWPWNNTVGGSVSLLDNLGRNMDYLRWIQSYTRDQQAPLGTGGRWMQPERLTPPSGFTLSRHEASAAPWVSTAFSAANPTVPSGTPYRDNAVDAYEGNDSPRAAPLINPSVTIGNLNVSPRPGSDTDDDWFGIPVSAGDTIDITTQFIHASGNLDMELYAPGEESSPLLSAASTTNDETLTLSSALSTANGSGIYRLRVFGNSGATNHYTLLTGPPPNFLVQPAATLTFAGDVGGPYAPACHQYTLTNDNASPINWQLSFTAPWISATTTSGTIPAGSFVNIDVCIDEAGADEFPVGIYSDTLAFEDLSNSETINRTLELQITIPTVDYFTELFDKDHPPDVTNQSVVMVPDASPEQYHACLLNADGFPVDPTGATVLALSDDGSATINLTGGQQVQLYGTSYSTFHVNANGNITFSGIDGTYTESLAVHFAQPRVAGWFDDLDPSLGGTVSWQSLTDRVVITFDNVPEITEPANTVDFQIEMFTNGSGIIRITHLTVLAEDGIVGLSSGPGSTPGDHGPSDLSSYGPCTLNDWHLIHFGPGNPPGSGELEDPEGDTILNIWEYFLGLNPLLENSGALAQTTLINISGTDFVAFNFTRSLSTIDLTYEVQISTDLLVWTPHPDSLISTTGLIESRQALAPLSLADRIWFRLKISW